MPKAEVNPNDYKVVMFTNKTDFTFTPEMGCMFDGRPISGITGAPGVNAGESLTLPYHIGHRLATNLAKIVKIRQAPVVDVPGIPTGKPLWSDEDLESVKSSYLTELYSEAKATPMTETDRLMAKVEEYKKMVDTLIQNVPVASPPVVAAPAIESVPHAPVTFADKQDVMAELDKRQIKYDKRTSKANLEKLLT